MTEKKTLAKAAGIHAALIAVMRDTAAIAKDRKNVSQGFQFRGIDDVYNALHDILARHGVVTVPRVTAEHTEERQTQRGGNLIYRVLQVEYDLVAEDGSTITLGPVVGEGMDSGDKAASKAMAIAHKYALLQLWCIPTADAKDPDADTPPPSTKREPPPDAQPDVISAAQRKRMFTLATKAGVRPEDVKQHLRDEYGIEHSADILWVNYDDVCRWIEEHADKANAKPKGRG